MVTTSFTYYVKWFFFEHIDISEFIGKNTVVLYFTVKHKINKQRKTTTATNQQWKKHHNVFWKCIFTIRLMKSKIHLVPLVPLGNLYLLKAFLFFLLLK